MNLWVVVLSLLVGGLRSFRFGDLLSYQFRGLGWFAVSLGLQMLIGTSFAQSTPWLRAVAPLLNLGSMGMLLAAVWANRVLGGARFCGIGVALNFAAIFANGGRMPVSLDALHATGVPSSRIAFLIAGRSLTHRLMRPGTTLWVLGDLLYLPSPFQRSSIFSIGDVVLAGGLFLLIQDAMARTAHERQKLTLG